jgi:hypothetical protein
LYQFKLDLKKQLLAGITEESEFFAQYTSEVDDAKNRIRDIQSYIGNEKRHVTGTQNHLNRLLNDDASVKSYIEFET